jgi:hypothetical protein
VTSHIGGGHVLVADQSKSSARNIAHSEPSKSLSSSWRPEQNQAINSGGESVSDVFPARGEVVFDNVGSTDRYWSDDFAGGLWFQSALLVVG